jgi:hypothetical protein
MLFLAHFGTLCALCALDLKALTQATCVQKITFVGVVFEKKRFEAKKVKGNAYAY